MTRRKQPWLRIENLEELTIAFIREVLGFDDMVADIIRESNRKESQTVAQFPLWPDTEKEHSNVVKREE